MMRRTLCVVVSVSLSLIASAATSFGATPTNGTASVQVTTFGGMTMMTLAWVLAGIAILVAGLFAASKSGKHVAAPTASARVGLSGTASTERSDASKAALAI